MTKARTIGIVGAAVGRGAQDSGCQFGPAALRRRGLVGHLRRAGVNASWVRTLTARSEGDSLSAVRALCAELSQSVDEVLRTGAMPLVLGGDHSCAIGTFAAVSAVTRTRGPLGLLWIDAHMDAHVPATSPSGAWHGMPLACLLGYGEPELLEITGPHALKAEHVCLVGVRSFEAGEAALLARLGVRVFFIDEVQRRGLDSVMQEAHEIVTRGTVGFGITLDVDALDPREAPGVGSPAENGLQADDLVQSVGRFAHDARLAALEITEYNPLHDVAGRTAGIVKRLTTAVLSGAGTLAAQLPRAA
jgi:arginase